MDSYSKYKKIDQERSASVSLSALKKNINNMDEALIRIAQLTLLVQYMEKKIRLTSEIMKEKEPLVEFLVGRIKSDPNFKSLNRMDKCLELIELFEVRARKLRAEMIVKDNKIPDLSKNEINQVNSKEMPFWSVILEVKKFEERRNEKLQALNFLDKTIEELSGPPEEKHNSEPRKIIKRD